MANDFGVFVDPDVRGSGAEHPRDCLAEHHGKIKYLISNIPQLTYLSISTTLPPFTTRSFHYIQAGSLLVDVVKAPVVVIVSWGAIGWEVFLRSSCVVDIGDEVGSYFVSVLQEDVDSVVVADELGDSGCEGVDFVLAFVNPVV